MTTVLHALVEDWPSELNVYVHELPGLFMRAETLEDIYVHLPDAVDQHLAWLATHGFQTPDADGLEIGIAEHISATGGHGPCFELDGRALTSADIDEVVSIAALARRDLIDLYRSVSAFRRDSEPRNGWSLAQHLKHVAETELTYINKLVQQPGTRLPGDPLAALQESGRQCNLALRSLSDVDLARSLEIDGELWTARKAARRLTGHLREHYAPMRALAST